MSSNRFWAKLLNLLYKNNAALFFYYCNIYYNYLNTVIYFLLVTLHRFIMLKSV